MREPEERRRSRRSRATTPYGREQREAEPAVGQLLDDGREKRDGEEEGDEGACAARVPAVGDEPLLLRRVEVAEEREQPVYASAAT